MAFGGAGRGLRPQERHGFGVAALPPGVHTDRRLSNLEWGLNDMQKIMKQMNDFNIQDHKTLQEALQESVTQVNDFRNRITQEIAQLKANHASLMETRTTLQAQVKQLSDFRVRAEPELARLREGQLALKAEQEALRECLVACGPTQAQIHERRRTCEGLAAFRAALGGRQVMCETAQCSGDHGAALMRLSMTANSFAGVRASVIARRAQGELSGSCGDVSRAAHEGARAGGLLLDDLDEGSWRTLADFEPSRQVLDEWAKNETVQHAFSSLRLQGIVAVPEVMNFSDVYHIFGQLELGMEQFVNKFTYLPSATDKHKAFDLEEKASAILKHFAREKVDSEERISRSDVYRLLELVGFPLQRFKAILRGEDESAEAQARPEAQLTIGSYRICRQIGQGFKGVCCYLAKRAADSSERVAIKWPASKEELAVFQDIHQRAPKEDCLGVPRLLDHGMYEGQPYLVTDLLGSTLASVFEMLSSQSPASRWPALRLIGRLVVRRLQSLHSSGYVHCDISPENILVGHTPGSGASPKLTLYLIDFELAQKYPGGNSLSVDQGSAEWCSIRSADGGERFPVDDLEAVGWVLLNGLAGALPWFEWLQAAYKDWDSQWVRQQATKQVRRAKMLLLEEGWDALPSKKPLKVPEELARFLWTCRQFVAKGTLGQPDYGALLSALEGRTDLETAAADEEDLLEFERLVAQVNQPAKQKVAEKKRKAQARLALKKAAASKDITTLHVALREAEALGLLDTEEAQLARSLLQREEVHDAARQSLQEAVSAADSRRICSALREAEMAGLAELEMVDARRALDESDDFG